jgi:hypothetical protein
MGGSMRGGVHPSTHDRERVRARQWHQQRQQQLAQRSSHDQRGALLPEKQHQNRRADDRAVRWQAGKDQ